ncbi:MAG: pilus assembly protein PilM [Firmicutes bacterium]|nr:pilus assembly protein PilM [Bacillota bacterium]
MLKSKKNVVGVELDTGFIRAVELKNVRGTASIEAAGQIAVTEKAVQSGVVQQPEVLVNALQKLWHTANFQSRQVVLAVFNHNVLLRFINYRKIKKDKLKQAILWQLDSYLPLSSKEMVVDVAVLGENQAEEKYEVMLVAAKKTQLVSNITPFFQSKLITQAVDVVPLALLRLLSPAQRKGTIVMLDLALGLNSLVAAVDGLPRLATIIPHSLQQYLQQLDLSLISNQVSPHILKQEERDALSGWCKAVKGELESAIDYFLAQQRLTKVDKLYLSGYGARMQGIRKFLQKEIGMPVETIRPAAKLTTKNKELQLMVNNPEFAVSTGLAMYGWKG